MSDKPNNTPLENHDTEQPVTFSVMPQDMATGPYASNDGKTHNLNLQQPVGTQPVVTKINSNDIHLAPKSRKWLYIVLTLVILIALGAIAYFMLGVKKDDKQSVSSKLPQVWLQQYFGAATCGNQSSCGDSSDPDNDGLGNYDEFKNNTDPKKNDTDSDGLADGDEVNIYKTEANLKFTDRRPDASQNNYTDGSQIKNGYDPLTPLLKMTDTRKNQIEAAINKFGLHEPTIATLKETQSTSPATKNVTVFIQNNKFDQQTITVNVNDTVIWLNKDEKKHQIASDPHPTHTGLKDLESGELSLNQTFNFKFTTAGTFTYHDHLNPTIKGTVVVK